MLVGLQVVPITKTAYGFLVRCVASERHICRVMDKVLKSLLGVQLLQHAQLCGGCKRYIVMGGPFTTHRSTSTGFTLSGCWAASD